MKKTFLIILLGSLITPIGVFAQFFQKTKAEIIKDNRHLLLTKDTLTRVANNGKNMFFFFEKDDSASLCFVFNKDGECDSYMVSSEKKYLTDAIKTLNSSFIKLSENTWITPKKDIEVTLSFDPKKTLFTVMYRSLLN